MKKILPLLILVLLATACKKTEPENNNSDNTNYTSVSYILGQYGGTLTDSTNSPHWTQFLFSTEGVTMDAEGNVSGTGKIYLVTLFSASIDADLFPNSGEYQGSDSFLANTFYCSENAQANGCTAIYTVTNGNLDENSVRIKSGTIQLSGNTTSSDFKMKLTDVNGNTLNLRYNGPAAMEDARDE